jgi:hypothetical protein
VISQVIKSRIKANVSRLLDIRVVKRSIENIPVVRKIYPFVHRTHPFDRFYGIHTGGFVPVEQLHPDPSLRSLINPYLGSQPSVVRKALAALGDVRDYAFVDLGCGLGRATTVASEFPFRVVMGVELASALAAEARANAATVAYRYPARPKVTITEANVLDFPFPPGKLVLFNYNAFGSELIEQTIKRCDAELASGDRSHLFFI